MNPFETIMMIIGCITCLSLVIYFLVGLVVLLSWK